MSLPLRHYTTLNLYSLIIVIALSVSLAGALRPAFAASSASLRRSLTTAMAILDSPSAERNKEPIWNVLNEKVLPLLSSEKPLEILEIAAGSGVHTEHFASKLSERGLPFHYFPSDLDATSRASIQARIEQSNLVNVESPLCLTLNADGIMQAETVSALDHDLDLIICINMIHISPWDATRGLVKLAGNKLRKGGVLFCYGPYKVGGAAVESNLNFDRNLRMRNPEWGVRDLESIEQEAEANGLTLEETIEMPANNLSVIYVKQ